MTADALPREKPPGPRALDVLTVPLQGTQLIEASAGTGKTYTIATLFVRLVVEKKLDVDRILVVTFTNAATAELRDRVRKRLREAVDAFDDGPASPDPLLRALAARSLDRDGARGRLVRALGSIDEAAIHTIHGFAQRVLTEHAFEGGVRPELELLADVRPLVAEIVEDFWAEHVEPAPRAAVEHLRKRKTGASELTLIGLQALRTPDAPIVVESAPGDLDAALEDYFRTRERVAAAWGTAREEVHLLLQRAAGLNQRAYKPKQCSELVESMDALVASDARSINAHSADLSKLSARDLRTKTNKGFTTPQHPFFELCDSLCSAHAKVEVVLEVWAQRLEERFIALVRTELPARTAARSSLSFDDLLLGLRGALRGPRGKALTSTLRRRFPAALIDEFHDTDPIQYEIFQRVYSSRSTTLFLIGDPKQAIYAFRGADVFAYLSAVRRADGQYSLGTNHRSDPTLVHAVNSVFSRVEHPFLLPEIRFEPVRAREGAEDGLRLADRPWSGLDFVLVPKQPAGPDGKRAAPSATQVAGIAAAEIARALHARPTLRKNASSPARELQPGDFAVLTRKNQECHEVQRELRALGIPSVLHGDTSVLETDEAEDMRLVLAALSDPTNGTSVRSALSTELFGLGATELFLLGEDEGEWERWTTAFSRWHDVWKSRGFLQAVRTLFTDAGVAARVLTRPGGERSLTNFYHLTELCHRAALDLHLGVAGLVTWFDEVRHSDEARAGLTAEFAQVRLESDERAVQLTTMHRSKGLEYPFVVLPYLWSGGGLFSGDRKRLRYHDPARNHALVLDLRREGVKAEPLEIGEREALAESLRLAYVALTRARHRCVVVWGGFKQFEKSALARLLHPKGAAEAAASESLLADLEVLSADSGGAVTARELGPSERAPSAPADRQPAGVTAELVARVRTRELSGVYRTSSFSALTAGGHAGSQLDDGRDLDAEEDPTLRVDASPTGEPEAPVPLDDFPRGPRAGDVLHAILEDADFERRDPEELLRLSRQHLGRQGFDAMRWAEPVAAALAEVLDTPLVEEDASLRLGAVPLSRRRSEMEFTFPAGGARGAPLTPERLGKALARREGHGLPTGYAAAVSQLGFAPLAGYLRGFVDLVFEHAGRYYVVDYKSNHLGAAPSAYRAAALVHPMAQHHYFLQYHVYLVALHRHLASRLPGYSYEQHVGGVLYLFVRGMSPRRGPRTGVFFDRPGVDVVEDLSRVLGTAGSSVAAAGKRSAQ